jgi:AcrR family transcriptional regulator
MTASAVHYHFPSRQALVDALFDLRMAHIAASLHPLHPA